MIGGPAARGSSAGRGGEPGGSVDGGRSVAARSGHIPPNADGRGGRALCDQCGTLTAMRASTNSASPPTNRLPIVEAVLQAQERIKAGEIRRIVMRWLMEVTGLTYFGAADLVAHEPAELKRRYDALGHDAAALRARISQMRAEGHPERRYRQ
jgi:hypothetical protein